MLLPSFSSVVRMSDQGFPRRYRLRKSAEFARVFERRRSVADELLVVYGCESGLPYPRIGLAVSRKVGGAVVRNRWKRLLREAFRLSRGELPAGVDLVALPRRGGRPELARLMRSLPALARGVAGKLEREGP